LYFVLSAMAVAFVVGWSFLNRIKPHFNNEILPNLSQYIQYIVLDIGSPPDLNKARSLTDKLPFQMRIEGPDINWSSSPGLHTIDTYRFSPAPYPYQNYSVSRQERYHYITLYKGKYQYLFAVKNSFKSGSSYRHWLLFALLASILLMLYLSIRRLFSPIREISQHLKKIGTGQLDLPIEIKGTGELVQLAQGINDMTVDIQSMLENKAGLLLAISHELRSPMTRMRINLELLDDEDKRLVLIQDLREMEELVAAILESERLNKRQAKLNRCHFDIAELVNSVIEQHFSSFLISKDLPSIMVNLDATRIKLLARNLLDNACRYSLGTDKAVEVKLRCEENSLVFIVVDRGPGVAAEDLTHLTEPFYRTDGARQRKTGGYGLGLYLCRLIAEAHDGELHLESELGRGMAVVVRIPMS